MSDIYIKTFPEYKNWGDQANGFFIEKIIGRKPTLINCDQQVQSPSVDYLIIGSILWSADNNSIVWGAGFIAEDNICKVKPKKVLAVRGPLSRNMLLSQNISCPEIYGDPVLLMPRFYNPKIEKKYKLGIVPHLVDENNQWFKKIKDGDDIKILSVKSDDFSFVDELLECEKIASSSLHGLIAADAYGIPSLWLEFSDKVIGKGFKFQDYFASVGRLNENALQITENTSLEEIMAGFKDYKINIDLDKLWSARPEFMRDI